MANNIKGITIEIGGDTTKLTKALGAVDKSLRDTQASLKDVDKLLRLDPSNIDLLKQKQVLLNKSIEDTKSRLDTLKQAQAQMDQNGVDRNSQQYQNLQREIIATENNLKNLESQASKCNPVLQSMAANADAIGDKFSAASQKLAPFSAAAGAIAGGLAGLGYKAVTAADDLNTMAKQTGLSTADLQKFQYASDRIDVSLDTMVGGLTKMKKNMTSTSKETVAAWDTLGISVTNVSDGSMRDAKEVFGEAVQALSQIENETQRDQLAMQLFGKSADQLAGIIDDGGAALDAYGAEAEEMGLILSQDTLDRLNETNDTIDQMKATFGASLLELGATVAEALAPVVEQAAGIIGSISQKLQELNPQQMQLILTILAVVAALAPILAIGGKIFSGISSILTTITALSGFITGTLIPAIGAISAPVLAVIAVITGIIATLVLLYQHNEDFRAKVNDIWQQIQQTISMVITMIQTVIQKFIAVVSAAWQAWGDNIMAIVMAAWNFIFTQIQTVMTLIQDVINIIMAAISGDWSGVWNGILKLVNDIWSGIKNNITAAIKFVQALIENTMTIVKGVWDTIWDGLSTKVSTIWETIKETAKNMVEGILEKVGEIKTTVEEKVGEAVQYLQDLPGKALTWGSDMIENFVDGVKQKWEDLKGAVGGVAQGINDYIGFSEPTKGPLSNFHTYAPDMMQLFAQGIRDNLGLVTSAMDDVAGTVAGSAGGMAMVNVTSNTWLDGQLIASQINSELGAML